MKKLSVIVSSFLCFATAALAQNGRFFNLTASDVKIDSVMPMATVQYDLPANQADSIYSVTLKYPEFYDMSAKDIEAYKALSDELPPEMPEVMTDIICNRKEYSLVARFCPVVYRDGKYQFLVSYMTELSATSDANDARMRAESTSAASRYASHSVLANGRWAKIRVSDSGIHQLTDATIRKAGFTDLSKVKVYGYGGHAVPESLDDAYLRSHDDLMEVPTCMVDGKKMFYANGVVSWNANDGIQRFRNPYSDYGYYFITQSDDEPLTISESDLIDERYSKPETFHSLYEKDEFAWMQGGRNLVEKAPIASTRDYTLKVPAGNTRAKFTISISGIPANGIKTGKAQIAVNDSVIGEISATLGKYDIARFSSVAFEVKSGLKEENKVTIKNISFDELRLDYISVAFDTPATISSLSEMSFPSAEYVHNITNQDLHSTEACDMVIIIPTSQFTRSEAERLKAYHEQYDSLRVAIYPADELYNEFSSGTPDVSAYRRFMKMLYDRAQNESEMPRYLLMFGGGVWDNRLKTSQTSSLNADNLLLSYESDNSTSHVYCFATDDFIAMLDDKETAITLSKDGGFLTEPTSSGNAKGTPDIGVGRLPMRNREEAKIAVDKILYYASHSNDGPWQNEIMFLGDDGNSNTHMKQVDDLANIVIQTHPGYQVRKVMWDAFIRESTATGHRYPQVTSIVKKQQANGALIIDYAGHGAPASLSHEYVLTLPDFQEFRGTNYPLWVAATCDIMPWDGMQNSIGEAAVFNSKGGAIGFYGTVRTVLSNYNRYINHAFIKAVLGNDANGRMNTVGDANRIAKTLMVTSSPQDLTINKLQYTLLCDPALRLARPQYTAVIDSINGIATSSSEMPVMPAGSIVSIKGHIDGYSGKATDFNGQAKITVRDTEQKIVCKLQNTLPEEGAQEAFFFNDRTNVLYQGSDSIIGGEFSFLFAIPKDINYSYGTGLINVYAMNAERNLSAHGAYDKFVVNGSQLAVNDSIGPSIYCYLNDPEFENGGTVNSTPFFVANIMDEDGINASGAGIGHDLQLTIDGQASMTYSLNDNFQYDFGSYTSGQTYYVLPKLEPGKHTLRFRAWDIMNNPSTTSLSFVVKGGLAPSVASMYATPNPASDSVKFVVSHDRPGSEVMVEIEVMDAAGRLLWSTDEVTVTNDSYYTATWNLCLANGAKLQTGVYLYRIRMSCDGSESVSLAKKLIIVN